MTEKVRRRVRVRGRVQGVGFRGAIREQALGLSVAGWVRNLPDGSVEALLEGPEVPVEALIAFCRRGPPGARVGAVELSEEPAEALEGFEIRR